MDKIVLERDRILAASDVMLSGKNTLAKPVLLNSILVKVKTKSIVKELGLLGRRRE